MKTQKHYKRRFKQTMKNKIKKPNVTRKYMRRGGGPKAAEQKASRTARAANSKRAVLTEAENVKKHGAELLMLKRDKNKTKKQRDLEAKETAAKTAAEVAVTFAINNEIIPIVEEEAIIEAHKLAPGMSSKKIVKKVLDFTSIIGESAKKAANSTLGVAIKNKFKAKPKQEPPPQQNIKVWDNIDRIDKTPYEFFEEHKNDEPFILVSMIEKKDEKEDEKERQRLEDENKDEDKEQEKEGTALSNNALSLEQEQSEASPKEQEKEEGIALSNNALSLEQEQSEASPKKKKVSSKKSSSARPPSSEYRYSSSSSNKPNSYALLAAPRYNNYFSDASDKPNSYALLNSRRKLSGGGKSRHTSRKQRIK